MSEANSTTEVEYRPIAGFPGYRVGDDGSVWSARKFVRGGGMRDDYRQLANRLNSHGYHQVGLYDANGKRHNISVHKLVLEAFIGPRPDGMDACHGNGVQTDNRLVNLRWATRVQNSDDKRQHGTHPSHPQNGAKLTADIVASLPARIASGETQASIAREKGVSPTTIRHALIGKKWGAVSRKSLTPEGEAR